MSELAAHLVDRVLPHVPIRQWVFTVPVPVRYQLAFDAGLTRAVLRVFLRTVFGWQRRCAARRGLVGVRSGSVTAIQRFGGSANLNVHFHALLFDGVYTRVSPTARPRFHHLPPPTDADITALLNAVVIDGGKMQSGGGGASTQSMLDWTDEQWEAIRPKKK